MSAARGGEPRGASGAAAPPRRSGGFDLDLHRDAAFAFGPASLREGAILPYEGRSLMTRADGLQAAVFTAEADGWWAPCNPVLVRGRARILPLAWGGDPRSGYHPSTGQGEMAVFASRMQSAGMYWAGNWRVVDDFGAADAGVGADSVASYRAALRAAGATQADVWRYSGTIGIALVWAGEEAAGTRSLALHVVPASWVSEPPEWASDRRKRDWRPVRGIDVRWSWADVIELYAARADGDLAP